MKERGKAVAEEVNGGDPFSLPEVPCREHPRASNVGVCAYCLKDRLLNLVCSECGEQRLSSCSCSDDLSSNRNSCAQDVGSVGRISFLLENEKQQLSQGIGSKQKSLADKSEEEVVVLRRSSSSCVEIRRNGIWKLGRLFRRKKKRQENGSGDPGQSVDCSKSELWVFDGMAVSRSRSVRSFRGGDNWNFSGGRSSSVNGNLGLIDSDRKSCFSEAEMRRSGFSDSEMRKSCFSEADARKSAGLEGVFENGNPDGVRLNRRIFSLKESDYFSGMDERNFIDLKFFFAGESKGDDIAGRTGNSAPVKSLVGEGGELRNGSCRVTARDKWGTKKGSRSFMGWRWVFGHHHHQQQQQQQQQQNPNDNGKRKDVDAAGVVA